MLASSALVLLMVPRLALFYGGMVRRKNILTTMLHSFVAMAAVKRSDSHLQSRNSETLSFSLLRASHQMTLLCCTKPPIPGLAEASRKRSL